MEGTHQRQGSTRDPWATPGWHLLALWPSTNARTLAGKMAQLPEAPTTSLVSRCNLSR